MSRADIKDVPSNATFLWDTKNKPRRNRIAIPRILFAIWLNGESSLFQKRKDPERINAISKALENTGVGI